MKLPNLASLRGCEVSTKKVSATNRLTWKNIQSWKQCLCKFFSSSCKIFATFYGGLSQKWGMSPFCAIIVIFGILWLFTAIYGTFWDLYGTFMSLLEFLARYRILCSIHFSRNLRTFSGKIILAQIFLIIFFHVCQQCYNV